MVAQYVALVVAVLTVVPCGAVPMQVRASAVLLSRPRSALARAAPACVVGRIWYGLLFGACAHTEIEIEGFARQLQPKHAGAAPPPTPPHVICQKCKDVVAEIQAIVQTPSPTRTAGSPRCSAAALQRASLRAVVLHWEGFANGGAVYRSTRWRPQIPRTAQRCRSFSIPRSARACLPTRRSRARTTWTLRSRRCGTRSSTRSLTPWRRARAWTSARPGSTLIALASPCGRLWACLPDPASRHGRAGAGDDELGNIVECRICKQAAKFIDKKIFEDPEVDAKVGNTLATLCKAIPDMPKVGCLPLLAPVPRTLAITQGSKRECNGQLERMGRSPAADAGGVAWVGASRRLRPSARRRSRTTRPT